MLLASSLIGGVYLVILFFLCFAAVAGGKAARRYFGARTRQAEKPAEPEKKPEDKPPQRVYYIVEKKRVKRPASKYGEPKKIRFE